MNGWIAKCSPYLLAVLRMTAGLLFMQHGGEKLWGFAGGRIDHNFPELRALAGPIELVGGLLITAGLFTRTTAFILCGEMAVAYFRTWAPRGFFPISNGGEESVLFCFLYLWLVTRGAGPWSADAFLEKRRQGVLKRTLASWEPYGRSILRIILAFMVSLHGLRLAFGMFPQLARRGGAPPMPLDLLPQFTGYIAIAAGGLLLVGVLTRPAALVLSLESLVGWLFIAAPRAAVPLRAGANEVMLYFLIFLYLASLGAGTWSLDYAFQKRRRPEAARVAA